MNWDTYYINLLDHIASKSKDPRTKVGCVIVGPKNEIRTTAFNGFPMGVKDLEERYADRATKYKYVSHADSNAICFAARNGVALEGCRMYLPWYPCTGCAKNIIQSGIVKIIIDARNFEEKEKHWSAWKEDVDISKTMLNEAGVELILYNGE